MPVLLPDLSWIPARQLHLPQLPPIQPQPQQMLLVTHRDQQTRPLRPSLHRHPSMRTPVHDPTLRSTHHPLQFPLRVIAHHVVLAIPVQHPKSTIPQMQRPRRLELRLLRILPRRLRPPPLLQHLPVQRRLHHPMRLQADNEQHLQRPLRHNRKPMRTRKLSPPLRHQLPRRIINDHVVRHMIRQQNQMPLPIPNDPMAILHRRLLIQHTPPRHCPIPKPPLS